MDQIESGSHLSLEAKPRRELYSNTVVAWLWTQGTLLASILALPLLTRFLPNAEFGLWSLLLALNALATLADFGMSSVFLRRITAPDSSPRSVLGTAVRFYRTTGAALAAVLLLLCLVPGGPITPFVTTTHSPRLAALIVITAIVANLLVQPSTIRLLSHGRFDLQNVFGAGPAILGTVATVLAAYLYHSALAVTIVYAGVELLFDVALVAFVTWSRRFRIPDDMAATSDESNRWRHMMSESWRIFLVVLTPQLMVLIDAVIIGRIAGPAAVGIYIVAAKVGDLVTRLFWPFSDSLFISLCRATGADRIIVERHAASLGWLVISSGLALGCAVAAVGGHMVTAIFGHGYGRAEAPIIVLLTAATIRSMYMPTFRRIQADGALGSVPKWFAVGLIAHVVLVVFLAELFSVLGAALAVLAAVALFEAWPVAREGRRHSGRAALSQGGVTQLRVALMGGTALLLLTWCRIELGGWAIAACVGLAITLGVLSFSQLFGYLRSSRNLLVQP